MDFPLVPIEGALCCVPLVALVAFVRFVTMHHLMEQLMLLQPTQGRKGLITGATPEITLLLLAILSLPHDGVVDGVVELELDCH